MTRTEMADETAALREPMNTLASGEPGTDRPERRPHSRLDAGVRALSVVAAIVVTVPGIVYAMRRVYYHASALTFDYRKALGIVVVGILLNAAAAILQSRRRHPSRIIAVLLACEAIVISRAWLPRMHAIARGWPFNATAWLDRYHANDTQRHLHANMLVAGALAWDARVRLGRFPNSVEEFVSSSAWPTPSDVWLSVETPRAGREGIRLVGRAHGVRCELALSDATPANRMDAHRDRSGAEPDHSGVLCAVDDTAISPTTVGAAYDPPRPAIGTVTRRAPVIADGAWTQYRGNASRTGTVRASPMSAAWRGWRATMAGPARGTATIVGNVAIAGAHGNGMIEARLLDTGELLWRAREPNWIHQDLVVAHGTVVAGFGDNSLSFRNEAPSGLSARDLRTGLLLWRHFTTGSVMTGALIVDSLAVAATSDGEALGIDLATGAVRWQSRLPGAAIMAPAAMTGDTVFYTLDPNVVCAISGSTGKRFWCRTIAGTNSLGHSGPMYRDGILSITGTHAASLTSVLRLYGVRRFLDEVYSRIRTGRAELYVQEGIALAADGTELARTSFGGGRWLWDGSHTSGTDVAIDGQADVLVVAPVPRVLIRLSPRTERIVWRSVLGHPARGPVLQIGDHAIVTSSDGLLSVFSVATGKLACSEKLSDTFDRAGPTRAGSVAVLAGMTGGIYALPLEQLASCHVNLDALPRVER